MDSARKHAKALEHAIDGLVAHDCKKSTTSVVQTYLSAQQAAIVSGKELRKASQQSMQEVELGESQDSESMVNALQDTFMRDASDEASVDPDASKEEKQLVTEASKLKQQVNAGGAEKAVVSHQGKMERAAAELDLQQRNMLATNSASGGPCSISKSTMEELCAHGEDKICLHARDHHKHNCLNQKATGATKSAVAKKTAKQAAKKKVEVAKKRIIGPEDQALAKLGSILNSPAPASKPNPKKIQKEANRDKVFTAADEAAKATAPSTASATAASSVKAKEHPVITAMKKSDADLKQMQDQVRTGESKLSESFNKLQKEKTDLVGQYSLSTLNQKARSKERATKLGVLHNEWDKSQGQTPQETLLHQELAKANADRDSAEERAEDMKSAYDQQVIALATQGAERSKEAMQNRRKAEEAKQDAENTKQSAAEAEGELARRASRSMSAMQRKQAREEKAAAQKVQKAEADAMDEVSLAKRQGKRKIARADRKKTREGQVLNATVTQTNAELQTAAATEEQQTRAMAAKSSVLQQKVQSLAAAQAGNGTALVMELAAVDSPHKISARVALSKWHTHANKAEATAREKEAQSNAKLETAKEISVKQIAQAKMKAKAAVIAAETNKKRDHAAAEEAAKVAKHAKSVVGAMNKNNTKPPAKQKGPAKKQGPAPAKPAQKSL